MLGVQKEHVNYLSKIVKFCQLSQSNSQLKCCTQKVFLFTYFHIGIDYDIDFYQIGVILINY